MIYRIPVYGILLPAVAWHGMVSSFICTRYSCYCTHNIFVLNLKPKQQQKTRKKNMSLSTRVGNAPTYRLPKFLQSNRTTLCSRLCVCWSRLLVWNVFHFFSASFSVVCGLKCHRGVEPMPKLQYSLFFNMLNSCVRYILCLTRKKCKHTVNENASHFCCVITSMVEFIHKFARHTHTKWKRRQSKNSCCRCGKTWSKCLGMCGLLLNTNKWAYKC